MVCPGCGREHEVSVYKTVREHTADGKRTDHADTRQVLCHCGVRWIEESRMKYVLVRDPLIDEVLKVTVEEYKSVWKKRDDIHPKQMQRGLYD